MKPATALTAIRAFIRMLLWIMGQGLCGLLIITATPFILLGHALTPRHPRCPHR